MSSGREIEISPMTIDELQDLLTNDLGVTVNGLVPLHGSDGTLFINPSQVASVEVLS